MKKNIVILIILIFAGIQFIRINKSVPNFNQEDDFIAIHNDNILMNRFVRNACYDCHSYHTEYPWYSNVAPVSWWIKHHVNEGREHVNFSDWTSYSAEKQTEILLECADEVSKGDMPLPSFVLIHSEAKISSRDKVLLSDWFREKAN